MIAWLELSLQRDSTILLFFMQKKYEELVLKQNGKKDSAYIRRMLDVGVLARYVGDFKQAEEKLKETMVVSVEIFGKNSMHYGNATNELGAVFLMLNNWDKAEENYKIALEVRRLDNPFGRDYANSLNNLSNIYYNMGKYQAADSCIRLAIPIIIQLKGEESYELGVYYTNLSKQLIAQEKFDDAETYLFKAIHIIKITRGESHPYMIHPNNLLAELYQHSGQLDKALACATIAMNIVRAKISEWHTDYRHIIIRMAQVYSDMGNVEESMKYFNELLTTNKKQIERNFTFLSDREKLSFITAMKQQVNSFYAFATRYKNQKSELACMAYNQELLLKGLLLESSKEIHKSILNSKDPELISIYEKLKKLRAEISKLYSLPTDKRTTDPQVLEEKANQTEKELIRRSDEYAINKASLSLTWQDIQKKLTNREAAIEFICFKVKGHNNYFAMVVTKECSAPSMIPLFDENKLDSVLHNTNRSSTSAFVSELYAPTRGVRPTYPDQTQAHGKELYEMIWSPLDSMLRKKKIIYYAPTGILHTISFAAIPDSKGNLLCDRYQLNCVGSTRQLAIKHSPSAKRKKEVLIYGGIEYSADSLMPASTRGNDLFAQR
ncbi:MAG: tetratricopeptide repeat protein, partial [Bacteroidota bacterium]